MSTDRDEDRATDQPTAEDVPELPTKRGRLHLQPSTRNLALLAAVAVILIALASVVPVPYVRLAPGPTANTLGELDGTRLITIEGRRTYPTEGHLNLTTVSVLGGPGSRLTIFEAFKGWWDGAVTVVPTETIYPPGTSAEQVREENAEEMQLSQQNATVAALRELDIPVTGTVVVQAIVKGSPALGKLKAGDRITSVGGKDVTTPEQVRDAITAHKPGDDVTMTVVREGSRRTETIKTTKAADGRAVVGIVPGTAYEFPFKVDIALNDVGGPSAGLMFALGIVDKLTPGELNGGKFVAGTGTIDTDGKVGPIGGIHQKLIGARGAGATIFLVPADNCAEAREDPPDGLKLVKVSSLQTAVDALDTIRTGQGALASCGR